MPFVRQATIDALHKEIADLETKCGKLNSYNFTRLQKHISDTELLLSRLRDEYRRSIDELRKMSDALREENARLRGDWSMQ